MIYFLLSNKSSSGISFKKIPSFGGKTYLAFGNVVKISNDSYCWYGRNADDHVSGGVVSKIEYKPSTKAVIKKLNVLTLASNQAQGITTAIIGNVIHLYISVYDGVDFQGLFVYKSTDGLTGEAFDSGTDLSAFLTYDRYNFYGRPTQVGNDYYITWYEHDGTNWMVNFLKTSDGITHINTNISDEPLPNDIGESSLIHLGGNDMLIVGRRRTSNYRLRQNYSNDLGVTWGGWQETNMQSGDNQCMPEIYLNMSGLIDCVYGDRPTGYDRISINNPLTVKDNATSWNKTKELFFSPRNNGTYDPLGYPNIIEITKGRYLILLCEEEGIVNSGEAYLYVGDGSLSNL